MCSGWVELAALDDVLIFSGDYESHLERLETVISKIKEAGLKISPK